MKTLLILLLSVTLNTLDANSIFLTIDQDPMTSMVIHQLLPIDSDIPNLEFSEENKEQWQSIKGELIPFPLELPYQIHRIELTGLKPHTGYALKSKGKIHLFRTLPDQYEEIRFIVAGDLYEGNEPVFSKIAEVAANQDPHLAILGGDLAYAHEKSSKNEGENHHRWVEWLELWSQKMVTPSGYMIPMISAIGNHDTVGHSDQSSNESPVFYMLFQEGYQVIDINPNISFFILDTGHTNAIENRQTDWLNAAMQERESIPFTFAVYHVPAWPSNRKFKGKRGALIRKHWVPVFDRHHLTAAFEHHEHTYKRSFPIKDFKKDMTGTLYLGSGGFGVTNIRQPKNLSEKWYLAQAAATPHFFFVKIVDRTLHIQAINEKGQVFDEISKS
jgi:hypothetical protein